MNSDFKDLLQIFNEDSVRYLLVGGYAVMHYSEPRYTKDIDLWVEATLENARKVYQALERFGAPVSSLTPEDFAQEGFFFQMGRPPSRIDILMSISGVKFSDAWQRKNTNIVEDIKIEIISKSDLIISKRAAGRAQDLVDLEQLEKISGTESEE